VIGVDAAPYLAVLAAAAVEGEVVFVGASALVASGHLQPIAVAASGAVGAALGDQFFFFALRAGTTRWLTPRGSPSGGLLAWVRRHQSLAALSVRFVPGLRITVTALCVAAGIEPWHFCVLNGAASLVWAAAVMGAVAYGGPYLLSRLGVGPLVAPVATAMALLAIAAALAPGLRRAVNRSAGASAASAAAPTL
jgi:membrane protein DedA with SNARE-associated domain